MRGEYGIIKWLAAVMVLAGVCEGLAAPIIRDVTVRQMGIGKTDAGYVQAHTRARAGQEMQTQAVSRDVRRLLDTGRFTSVDATVETLDNGVRLVYTVVPKLLLAAEPVIRGVDVFRTGKIRKWMDLNEGDRVDDPVVGVAVRDVLKHYREKSYAKADANWAFEPVDRDAGLVRLTVTFAEGEKAYIGGVRVTGNTAISAYALRDALQKPPLWNPIRWIWKKRYEPYELDVMEAEVRNAYRDRGYLDVAVDAEVVDRVSGGGGIAEVSVAEGIPYRLGDRAIEGVTLFPEAALQKRIGLRQGTMASMAAIDAAAGRIQAYYGDRGYLNTTVRPVLMPDEEAGTVDITFVVREGERVRIRHIRISGNTRTRDKVIRRELLVYPGEVYNQTRVKRSERRLNNLGFFEQVRMMPRKTANPEERDLVFEVAEKRTGQFMLGAGFSSIDKLIGFAELSQGNFDITGWPTFTGGGQKLRLRAQFGSRRKDYQLSLTEPWFMDRRLSLGFDVYRRDQDYTDYDIERTGASVRLGKALPGPNRVNLRYNIEESFITDISDTNTYYELDSYDFATDTGVPYHFEQERDRIKSTLRLTLTHDTRNNPFVPSRGNKLSLFYSLSGGPLGFDTDIYEIGTRTTSYLPLWFGHVLNFRTRFQFVEAFGETDSVPLSDRLFLGGGRTLRGFDYRDVGPKVIRPVDDADQYYNRSFGGQSLFMANLEYTVPIVKSIRFAAFYDIGNVWAEPYELDSNDLASSTGVGLRLDMPGFPIRIDRAWALETDDDYTEEDHWVIWIGYDY